MTEKVDLFTGRFFLIVVLFFTVYEIVSCTVEDRERSRIEANRKEIADKRDGDLFSYISLKKNEYQADTTWLEQLSISGEKKYPVISLYTNQIQDAFLNKGNILIFGEIEDIRNLSSSTYEITISTSLLELELKKFLKPELKFKLSCSRNAVDEIISNNKNNSKSRFFRLKIAVIGQIDRVESYTYHDSDGEIKDGRLLIGVCNEVLLAPQTFGYLRKNIHKL